jgi:hypothetical protein
VTVATYHGSTVVAVYCASAAATDCRSSVVATACCGPAATAAPREPSLAAVAVLAAARDALDERRLVGTVASDLSTLAGARGGGGRHPANARMRKLSPHRSKRRGYGGAVAYLMVENPRFLFLGGSADVVAAGGVAAAAPPVVSAARAGASAVRVASLVGCLAAGAPAPAPGAVSPAASATLGVGAKAPTSRGEPIPHRSPPPRSTMSTPKSSGRRVPAARAAGTSHFSVPGAPIAGSVDAKSALNANHTASRTNLASHAQRAKDVLVNFS